jgi:nucleotide-binding universal stress UspA family protein
MYQKVLVPLDKSVLAECALPHVIAMAKEGFAKEIILLTVADVNISYNNIIDGFDIVAYRDSQIGSFRKYLDDMESKLRSERITVTAKIIEGNRPAQAIIDFSQQNDVNLIVMATHGYTGVKKMLMGSVAFKVLHESHVPVLLIRPEQARK